MVTGNPGTQESSADRFAPKAELYCDNQTLLLIFGGSLGCLSNETLLRLQELLPVLNLRIIHQQAKAPRRGCLLPGEALTRRLPAGSVAPTSQHAAPPAAASDSGFAHTSSVVEIAVRAPRCLVPYPLECRSLDIINAPVVGCGVLVPDNQVGTMNSTALFDLVDNATSAKASPRCSCYT